MIAVVVIPGPPFWPLLLLPLLAIVLIALVRQVWDGEFDFTTSERAGRWCDRCHEMHDGHHRCASRLVGLCVECGRKRFVEPGSIECPAGHRAISEIHVRSYRWA